jgi:hypothetical protein
MDDRDRSEARGKRGVAAILDGTATLRSLDSRTRSGSLGGQR